MTKKNPGAAGTVLVWALACLALEPALAAPPSGAAPASAPAAAAPSTPGAGSSGSGSSAAIEAQMLAFDAVDQIAAHVAASVCTAGSVAPHSTIIIYDQAAFGSLQSFEAFVANIRVLIGAYKTLIPPDQLVKLRDYLGVLADARDKADTSALTPEAVDHLKSMRLAATVSIAGDPLSDLVSLVSAIAVSSNTETPGSVVIPDSALAVALTGRLTQGTSCGNKSLRVIYPPLFGNGSNSDFASADISIDIQVLQDVREYAHKIVHEGNLAFLKEHEKVTTGDGVLTASLSDIDSLYDSFMNSLLQTNAGMMGSAAVIQGYRLGKLLKESTTHVLLASVIGAGGTEHVHKTFWTALSSGDKITYSGGLIVNTALWDGKGHPELTELVRYKSGFTNADGAMGIPKLAP